MKILYINILYAPYIYGGAERTLQILVEGMAQRNHEVTVLTIGPDAGIREDNINGVRVIRVGLRNIYNVYWQNERNKSSAFKRVLWHFLDIYNPFMKKIVADVIRQEKPDLVSMHNLPGFSVSAWEATQQECVPIVQVLHDQYLLCPRCTMFKNDCVCEHQCLPCRTMRFFHPQLSNKVDAVVGVSQYILDHHLRHGYFQDSQIKSVIHNVRNNKQTLNVSRQNSDSTFNLGFIGTLDKSKGIEILLDAFKRVAKSNWRLYIAGRGLAQYEKFLHDTNNEGNIIFLGVQNPEDFYPQIDVLVVPSIWNDTLPGVVFEGMSYGTPIIGARRGGIPEMIEDGVNGMLFDPSKPHQLERAMIYMAENAEFRTSVSIAARNSSSYYLDMGRFISSYESVYRDIIDK